MRRLLVMVVLALLSVNVWAGEPIKIRADMWVPYNGDPSSSQPGYIVEIARILFEKAGYTLDYQVAGWTWDQALEACHKGTIDGVIGWTSSDGDDFIRPEEPEGKMQNAFFVAKGNAWRYAGPDSLKGQRVGVISGYTYGGDVDPYLEANKDNEDAVQSISDDNALELNVNKLKAGRLDVIIEDVAVFNNKVKELGMEGDFEQAGLLTEKEEDQQVFMAFSPDGAHSKDLAKIITDGVRELRTSGELQKILDKYGVKDWK